MAGGGLLGGGPAPAARLANARGAATATRPGAADALPRTDELAALLPPDLHDLVPGAVPGND